MARKPPLLRRKAYALSTIAGISLSAGIAFAEDEIKATARSPVLSNPYAAHSDPVRLPKHAQDSRGTSVVFRNPFAAKSPAPPLDGSSLPDPLSRWQRTAMPLDDPSPVKTAILTATPIGHTERSWPDLPASDNPRPPGIRDSTPRVAVESALSPDPLSQPIWLTSSDQDTLATSPVAQAEFVQLFSDQNSQRPPSDLLQSLSAAADAAPLLMTKHADSPEGWLAEAQQSARLAKSTEDFSGVIDLCQRAIDAGPDVESATALRRLAAWAHNRRGELVADAGRPEDAIRDFHAAISLDPNNSLAIHNRGVIFAQQEDFAAALSDFDRVIELNPGLALAHRNRAELLAAHGSMDEAVEDYSQAIDELPDDADLRCARALAFRRLGQLDRALADLHHAIQIAPDSPGAFAQRGNLFAEQNQFERALSDFEQAISIDPNRPDAHRSLAWLRATCPDARYRNAGQALTSARQAAKLSTPDDYLALDVLAAAQANAGQFDEAVAAQQQAISAAPAEFAKAMRRRLSLYEQRQPFRDKTATRTKRER
jgi:tetratricopeptide (TPR) repeat protein